MNRRARRRLVAGAMAGCAAVATACSTSDPQPAAARPGRPAPLPATAPYLVLTAPESGWAVWPSGRAWLLLHTADGFHTVDNRTPVGVPTDGGLVGAFATDRASVAVAPVEKLVRSPLMSAVGTGPWTPSQLPGGVAGSRGAVALTPTGTTVLTTTHGGTLVAQRGDGWQVRADASALPGAEGLVLDGVTWASDTTGWLTGHGRAGSAVAFGTTDGGATWLAISTGPAVAALPPCGVDSTWLLPVIEPDGHVRVLATADSGRTWAAGQPLPHAAGEPAWGCQGRHVWMVTGSSHGDRVAASSDGGRTWTTAGPAPAGLTDLTPTGGGAGFAASGGDHPTLWAVTDDGAHFTRVALPKWVATLGEQSGMD